MDADRRSSGCCWLFSSSRHFLSSVSPRLLLDKLNRRCGDDSSVDSLVVTSAAEVRQKFWCCCCFFLQYCCKSSDGSSRDNNADELLAPVCGGACESPTAFSSGLVNSSNVRLSGDETTAIPLLRRLIHFVLCFRDRWRRLAATLSAVTGELLALCWSSAEVWGAVAQRTNRSELSRWRFFSIALLQSALLRNNDSKVADDAKDCSFLLSWSSRGELLLFDFSSPADDAESWSSSECLTTFSASWCRWPLKTQNYNSGQIVYSKHWQA